MVDNSEKPVANKAGATLCLDPSPDGISEGAAILRAGGLVAFPTETVYGLGADATDGAAVARIFAAKNRPSFNPLIVHVPGMDMAEAIAAIPEALRPVAEAFWPGPLTLVVPLRAGHPISPLAVDGGDHVGLRVPAHPVARTLLETAGVPVAAPSANLSGAISPTSAAHVLAGLDGRIDAVIDGGASDVGIESTILMAADGLVAELRPGGLSLEEIRERTGIEVARETRARVAAPGQLASHYAPRAALRLDRTAVEDGVPYLGFGEGRATLNLSETRDLVEAAANLYHHLHALDATGAAVIDVAPVPMMGLGVAINDRLKRAAAPRPSSGETALA